MWVVVWLIATKVSYTPTTQDTFDRKAVYPLKAKGLLKYYYY